MAVAETIRKATPKNGRDDLNRITEIMRSDPIIWASKRALIIWMGLISQSL
jgi:hypothetical protein